MHSYNLGQLFLKPQSAILKTSHLIKKILHSSIKRSWKLETNKKNLYTVENKLRDLQNRGKSCSIAEYLKAFIVASVTPRERLTIVTPRGCARVQCKQLYFSVVCHFFSFYFFLRIVILFVASATNNAFQEMRTG